MNGWNLHAKEEHPLQGSLGHNKNTHKNDKKLCLKIHLRNQWSPMPSSFETLHLGQDAPSPLYLQNNKVCKRCKIILLFGHSKIQTDSDIWPRGINQECRNERLSRQEGRTENGQTEGVKECRNCRECIEMAYHGPALLWMRLTWTPCTDAMSGVPGCSRGGRPCLRDWSLIAFSFICGAWVDPLFSFFGGDSIKRGIAIAIYLLIEGPSAPGP